MRASASATELLTRCQYWAREGVAWADDGGNAYTAGGNVVDAYVNGAIGAPLRHPIPPPLPEGLSDEDRVACEHAREWLRWNARIGMRAQVAYAYDPTTDTARELPAGEFRDYERNGAEPHEFCGTVDIVCMGEDLDGPFVEVTDIKREYGDSKDHLQQLRSLALAAARTYRVERARIRVVRIRESGVDDRDDHWLDGFDLDFHAGELRRLLASVEGSEPAPGAHCTERYCKALAACPENARDVESVERLIQPEALVRKEERPLSLTVESPDHAAWMLHRVRTIEKMCEHVRAAVTQYVGEGQRLADGSELRPTFRTVARVDNKAIELLARRYGATDEDIAACVRASRENSGLRVLKGEKKGRAA